MSPETIFESPNATMWYHPDGKIIHHKITNFMNNEELSDFLKLGTKKLKETGSQKWLSDDLPNIPANNEDMSQSMSGWFQQTLQAGWKYWAIIKPHNVIAQLKKEALVKRFGAMGIEAQYFDNPEKALEWLRNIPTE
jgi:hypothetical protein